MKGININKKSYAMKEIDQYANMGFAIDIGKGVDLS